MNIPIVIEYRPGWSVSALGGTFARADGATCATYIDRNGIVQTVAANVIRDSHYITGQRTTILEPASTNGCLRSKEFDNAYWTKSGLGAVTADTEYAPDGTLTAERLPEDATAGVAHFARSTNIAITANATFAVSCFMKAGTRTWAELRGFDQASSDSFGAYFDLANGVVGSTVTTGTGTLLAKGIIALGNGWYRCWVVGSIANATVTVTIRANVATADNVNSYNGDGASFIIVWGAQLENNLSFPTTFIATSAATVTRAIDILTFPIPSALAIPKTLTMYAKLIECGDVLTGGTNVVAEISAAGNDNFGVRLATAAVGRYRITAFDSAAAALGTSTAVGAPTYGDTGELRAILAAVAGGATVQIGQSINGGAESVTAASAAFAMIPQWAAGAVININSRNGTNGGVVALQCLRIATGSQSMATLRAPASYILFTDAIGTAYLSNEKPFPGDRFSNWTPDSEPFGDSVSRQSDGALTVFRLRDDYSVHLELAHIPERDASNPGSADLADRLRYHLQNGGTCFVVAGDALGNGYGPMGLKPGTKPSLQLSDRRFLEYTFAADLLNLNTTPVRASAYYAEQ
jgi:hypothetical protein